MIETEAIRELKIIVRLLFEGKEIQTVEKPFAVQQENESEQTKSMDETVTEFLDSLQKIAVENGYVIGKESAIQTVLALILYMIKQDSEEKTIDVEMSRHEARENGDKTEPS